MCEAAFRSFANECGANCGCIWVVFSEKVRVPLTDRRFEKYIIAVNVARRIDCIGRL